MRRESLTVIIPLAPGDEAWTALAHDLALLPRGTEILLAGPRPPVGRATSLPALAASGLRLAWVRTPAGRGRQMNAAARAASGRFLWFLHADTRFGAAAVDALLRALERHPDALHYFDLEFAKGGPRLMPLNAAGVWLRSHLLRLPFGDQGLCILRAQFFALGGYAEDAPYGEDHLLVWQAHAARLALACTGGRLTTSPRKYQDRGWLPTTARHVALTLQQALPQLVKIYARRRA